MFVEKNRAIFIHENALHDEIFEDRETLGYYGKWIGVVRPTKIKREIIEIKPQ